MNSSSLGRLTSAAGSMPRWRQSLTTFGLALMLSLALSWMATPARAASPLAGTAIGNQATATYSDGSATSRTVTSNTVVTVVQQVAGLTLSGDGNKVAAIGGLVNYPHTLINTGNGSDTFALTATRTAGFTLGSVLIYPDANGDGVPDNGPATTSTGPLAPGASFRFVVVAVVPPTALAAATTTLQVTATSGFTPAVTASNLDTTTVSINAVVHVTKAIDVLSGAAGGGARTYTLTYTNVGNLTATNLTLTDVMPSGMGYVPNSARWSGSGATVLTDANAGDAQGGIVYDFNVSSPNRLTAVIAAVSPGTTGTLTFQATVNSGLAAGAAAATLNVANYAYNDGVSQLLATATNGVQFVVTSSAAVTLSGATVAAAPQGGVVNFTQTLTNTGNALDSFDLRMGTGTFPAGTTFSFFQADGQTPLLDTNANGVPDTGPLLPNVAFNLVVRAVLPPGATGGPYTVPVTATSRLDATQSAAATDTLTGITANQVDLTANSAGPGAPGVGPGPEPAAAIVNPAAAGSTSRFTLVISNGSAVADTFNLQASTDQSFGGLTLPAGWSVVFKDAGGAVLTNTGVINAGTSRTVYADVLVPAGVAADTLDVFFRAVSPTTGASDRMHAAVQIGTARGVSLSPSHTGQAFPGGSVVYPFTALNTGNILEGDGPGSQVSLAVSNSQPGFSATLYWDKNNNGALDAGDPVVTSLAQLTAGSGGASVDAGLGVGESALLFVKVFAPADAASGALNTSTITATVTGVVNSVAAPTPAVLTVSTSVVAGQVQLVITQALDAACDGTPDGPYVQSIITVGAVPGACLRYQVTASNVGVADAASVVISNATPANTTYHAVVPAVASQGTVTAPSAGAAGTVQATVGTLPPGQSASLSYGVRINP